MSEEPSEEETDLEVTDEEAESVTGGATTLGQEGPAPDFKVVRER